jgi:hypothetical protein
MAYGHTITTVGVGQKGWVQALVEHRSGPPLYSRGVRVRRAVSSRGHRGAREKARERHAARLLQLSRIKFTYRKDVSIATVKGTFAERHGSINMTFHATGPVIHPKSCDGTATEGRRGVLKGVYTLRAGKFFGKVTQTSFMATLWNGGPPARCSPRPR